MTAAWTEALAPLDMFSNRKVIIENDGDKSVPEKNLAVTRYT